MLDRPEDPAQFLALARYRSRRGMLEIDFFLVDFAEQALQDLPTPEQETYFDLLGCEDVDIHAWLTGKEVPADPALQAIVARIRAHAAQRRS